MNELGINLETTETNVGANLSVNNLGITVLTPHALPQSPILAANYDILGFFQITALLPHDQFSPTSDEYAHWVSLITALSLYSIQACEDAMPYFEQTEQLLDLYDEQHGYPGSGRIFNYFKLFQGNCALLQNDYDMALAEFESGYFSIHNINFVRPEYAVNRSWIYLQQGDIESAFSPRDVWIWTINTTRYAFIKIYARSKRAQLYALAFEYDSAIADMDAAIELAEANEVSDEQLAELYTLRGEIIFLIYEWDRVLENFNTALELNPDYAPAYFQRGVLIYTMTERESALVEFQHYLEIASVGEHAAEAQRYIDSIQLELESLGG